MSAHRTDPLIGSVLDGRYDVRARLARGGMSTVYRAVDLRLDREVALKILYPHLAEDPALVGRFEQEAKTAARLSHPHVVNVLDQGVDHGPDGEVAYLAMEYVPGYTLRTVLQRQRALTPRIALAYLDAIVDGLAAAHAAGLVHRDMKPENVLVSRDGRIKVADFGLARAATHHTGTGATLVGTVAYISPELVQGSPADERSDVYAVGIMAYELLTGRQPFTGSSPIQVAYQHINGQVPPPSETVPGLASELDEVVLWSTAKDPQDRPADARALRTELRRIRTSLADDDLDFEGALAAWGAAGISGGTVDDGGPDAEAAAASGLARTAGQAQALPDDGHPTQVIGAGATEALDAGATQVIGAGATQALDRGATQALGTDATEAIGSSPTVALDRGATVPLPARPPSSAHAAATAGAPPAGEASPSASRDLPDGERHGSRAARPPSPRRQRRTAARQARTPTEDLGRVNRRRFWIWGAVVLILAALLALLGWFFGAGPGGVVTVPDVEGHSRTAAVSELEDLGVGYQLTQTHHDLVAPDSVVSTDPPAGTDVRRFDTVLVAVSAGPERFAVPDLQGLDEQQVDQELGGSELRLGEVIREHSETVEEGQVISQDPAPGTELRRDHAVSVVVSDGPEPVAVPDVTGLTVEQARSELEGLGLQLEVAGTEHSAEMESGLISAQEPAEGEVSPGTTISVTESLGPQMVQVPDVTDLDLEQARQVLEEAGFEVNETAIVGDLFGDAAGRVLSQTPDAGEEAPEGSAVRLLVF